MSLLSGIQSFTAKLEESSVPFAIIGGIAVFAYGGERTTFDVDFLIHKDYRPKVKTVAEDLGLKIFNENTEVIQFSGFIQLDIVFANRLKSQEMLSRLKRVEGFPYPVAAPEDLVGLKIQAFVGNRKREYRDKGDILTIFKNVENLDFQRIQEYAEMFNVWSEIKEIKKHV